MIRSRYQAMRFAIPSATSLVSMLLFSLLLHAQTPQSQTASSKLDSSLRFEVATIKPHDPASGKPIGAALSPGGKVEIIAVSLKTLVCTALNVSNWQVSGGDSSTGKVLYDVEALPPSSLRADITDLKHTWWGIDDARLRQMLANLLIDRFQLRFHRDTKQGTVYLLERSGKPLRLAVSARSVRTKTGEIIDPGFGSVGFAGRWAMGDTSMQQLAKFAGDFVLHAPVHDETHLDGYFDYRSQMDAEAADFGEQDAAFPSFLSEMGLRLKKSRGPVETIVIDHAEKPSAN